MDLMRDKIEAARKRLRSHFCKKQLRGIELRSFVFLAFAPYMGVGCEK